MSDPSNAHGPPGIEWDDAERPAGVPDPMTVALALTRDQPHSDVGLAARGDAAAFERLYRAHLPRVTSLARWLLGTDDVDDAVQDVFIRVWQKLGTFQGEAAFGTWLHRVAVNLLVRRRQRRAVQWSRQVEAESALAAVAAPGRCSGSSSRPEPERGEAA